MQPVQPAIDRGLTHVALPVSNLDRSVAFYEKYAQMQVVHRRLDPETRMGTAWVTDGTRPFVIVLLQVPVVEHPLLPMGHLGVACTSPEEVDQLSALAKEEGCLRVAPRDLGPPIGYIAHLADPDGHDLELSYGQEVAYTVEHQVEHSHSLNHLSQRN
jgi:catechol 2,3-dioxygenase-like lactoylglutathione lyase family enzyme